MADDTQLPDEDEVTLDTRDVDRWIGIPLGGGQLVDPIVTNDIRRWAQGMQNPNPLYYDTDYAAESRFGQIVAPQSFAVCTDVGHGATPAIQGNVPGSHMLFGGDEWWFFGPRIAAGDRLRSERMLFDYRVTRTGFAGPTMFSRGDTTYVNQRGEPVAKQRSTSIRYLASEAVKRGQFDNEGQDPDWTAEDIESFDRRKMEYARSCLVLGHAKRPWNDVEIGEKLAERLIGPHSVMSFTTEWRSYIMTIWGSTAQQGGANSTGNAGWIPEMTADQNKAALDPAYRDGLYFGASGGHVQPVKARLIGMPRSYGYGASMGSWILDYLGDWGGEWAFIRHSRMQYRAPALTGDITLLNGEVKDKGIDPEFGRRTVAIEVKMTNQNGAVMAQGTAEVELPDST